jgi:hypothetical protein
MAEMVDWDISNFDLIWLGSVVTMSWIILIIILRFLLPWIDRKMQQRIQTKDRKYRTRESIERRAFRRKQQQQTRIDRTVLAEIQARIAVSDTSSSLKEQVHNSSIDAKNQEPELLEDFIPTPPENAPVATDKDRTKSSIDEDMNNSVIQEIQQQDRDRIARAELLIQQAKSTIDRATSNPFDDIDLLSQAISLYQQSYLLVNKQSCISAIEGLQIEIDRRHQFQSLMQAATKKYYHKQFSEALTILFSAQALYSPPQLFKTIIECEERAKEEDLYLQSLSEAKILSYAGKFRDALAKIDRAVAKFTRLDGEELQSKLNRVIAAKEQLNLGRIEQEIGNIAAAKYHYSAAVQLMPDWNEAKFKLAIIEARSGEISQGIERLPMLENLQITYLKGLYYARQHQYTKARTVWSQSDLDSVREYWRSSSNEMLSKFKLVQPQIEQLVQQDRLEEARTMSLDFIHEVGGNLAIENNLEHCILPGIEAKIWRGEDWQNIEKLTYQAWRNNLDLKSLHNWNIALYYAAQIDNSIETSNIENLLISFPTAIANIDLDPTLKNLPWLGAQSISIEDITSKLWQILEQQIETVKESDLLRYLCLRDRYRQEFWAIELAKLDPKAKIVIGGIVIPPACSHRYSSQISLGSAPQVWQTLYTNWGTAVAACLAGDPQRAETIRGCLTIDYKLEKFANDFILYEQGCYYLQQENWHAAIYPLNDVKTTISDNDAWQQRIDRLCIDYRHKIVDFNEHLDFAQFWYDLLSSTPAEAYLIEYKALKIHWEWNSSIVTNDLSLSRIKDLLDKYPAHQVVQQVSLQINETQSQN